MKPNSKGTVSVVTLSPPVMNADASYNEEQAALILNVSVRTLQSWRLRGGGPRYLKMGRLVRYRGRDLIEHQERNSRNSTSEVRP
jgi:hypothetical protein